METICGCVWEEVSEIDLDADDWSVDALGVARVRTVRCEDHDSAS